MASIASVHPLVRRILSPDEREEILRAEAKYPSLVVDGDTLLDLENLATGAFSPLEGFMGPEALESVVQEMRLPTGEVWSLPILLQQPERPPLAGGERALLRDAQGRAFGIIDVEAVYRLDLERIARGVYGTDRAEHPGVRRFYERGPWAVAGRIGLLRPVEHPYRPWALPPDQVRDQIRMHGWRTVVAFQTRNPPHRGHEYLQRLGLELADGLLIHPILGSKKEDDFDTPLILRAYEALIAEGFYPPGRVLLAGLATAMRYAGPREAVFHALVRRNFGCTHFLVGRDHAGVDGFYDPYAAHRIFDRLPGPIGIEVIRVGAVFYCRRCDGVASERTCAHPPEQRLSISMTRIRRMLQEGQQPPAEMIRPEVAQVLRRLMAERAAARHLAN